MRGVLTAERIGGYVLASIFHYTPHSLLSPQTLTSSNSMSNSDSDDAFASPLPRTKPQAEVSSRDGVKATRKRQRTVGLTRPEIVDKYKRDLEDKWVDKPCDVEVWYSADPLCLDCKAINPDDMPTGFVSVSEDRYQYHFTDPERARKGRYRPVAYRMPFLGSQLFEDATTVSTVSHLCHNPWCYNYNHHVLESLELNKARNGCPGGPVCRHKTKCLRPGPYSEA